MPKVETNTRKIVARLKKDGWADTRSIAKAAGWI